MTRYKVRFRITIHDGFTVYGNMSIEADTMTLAVDLCRQALLMAGNASITGVKGIGKDDNYDKHRPS